jgi:hypothetical protein
VAVNRPWDHLIEGTKCQRQVTHAAVFVEMAFSPQDERCATAMRFLLSRSVRFGAEGEAELPVCQREGCEVRNDIMARAFSPCVDREPQVVIHNSPGRNEVIRNQLRIDSNVCGGHGEKCNAEESEHGSCVARSGGVFCRS